jgi:diaminopimelate decarboxylase
MSKVVYAGVGKTDPEIRAALDARIAYFNIESEAEFENIAALAKQLHTHAQAALRINPDVYDPQTHQKTATGKKETKFGVALDRARRFFERYGRDKSLRLSAIHLHLGSPIYSAQPYVQAITKALELIAELRAGGFTVDTLDLGGGFAADYESGKSPDAAVYASAIVPLLHSFVAGGGKVILEPGRSIVANAGVLLARVQYLKMGGRKKFIITDTGMHHLARVALYESFHFIWPTRVAPMHEPLVRSAVMDLPGLEPADVVGPICESTDFFAKDRPLPPVARGDLLCIFTAGAYGMVMASNYNAMPRPPEVLVDGEKATLIRRRETYEDLVGPEREAAAV